MAASIEDIASAAGVSRTCRWSGSTRRPHHLVLRGDAAPARAGTRVVRDLPVPVGVERPAGRVRHGL